MISLTSLAIALLAAKNVAAVGSPFGYATGTTGGNSAAQAIPTSAAQLKSWLEDNVTRNILLDRTYDFTDTEGNISGKMCKSWTCSPNPQLILDTGSGCGSSASTTATYKKAGTSGIEVKSNKTIVGKGTSGWMQVKGKGLKLSNVSNVIIQNIRISDINPQYVWGGDALYIDNSSKVWIDHNYFKNVGRQFIVTGFGAAKQVTISNNYFDGQSYFNDITGHAIDADTGSKILIEGNYFNKVKTPSTGSTKGAAFAPTSSSMNSQCSGSLGRNCVSNTLAGGSGSLTNTANSGILSSFTASTVKSASIMDPAQVPSYVTSNAGLGKVN
ncbi:hypothetical protein RhiTH_011535 [Rhizoctonia solani]